MRLDEYLYKYEYFDSRTKAKQAIERKEIYVNGKLIDKSSFFVDEKLSQNIEKRAKKEFVSLGGYKLDKALTDFNFNVLGLTCIDVGASTGGFTQCLLNNGAKKVYTVDLNDQLLHKSLKEDERVIQIIKNAKNLSNNDFDENVDFLCADLSFISATIVMPVFSRLLEVGKRAILLIKPQFESGTKKRVKNGIIRDEIERKEACLKVYNSAVENGFAVMGLTLAPINKNKNVEFLILLEKSYKENISFDELYKNCKI